MNAGGVRLAPGLRRVTPELLVSGTRLVRLTPSGADALDALLVGRAHPQGARLRRRLVGAGALIEDTGPGRVDDVTVVIPFAGDPAALALTRAGIPDGVRVIVVDDNAEAVVAGALRTGGCEGPAAARNRGAAMVTTGLIAFVDADLDLPMGWLATLTGHFADPAVIAVAPRIVSAPGRGLAGVVERRLCALDLGRAPAIVGAGVSYLPSTVFLIRRSAFPGYDEKLTVGEDVDLIWRLDGLGQIRYDPRVVVRHQPRIGLPAALARRADYGASAGPLERRHPGRMRHLELDRWSAAIAAATLAHPGLGAAAVGFAVASAPRRLSTVPPAVARRLVAGGLARAAMGAGRYAARPGLPFTVAAALAGRRTRRVVPLLVLAHACAVRSRFEEVTPAEFPGRLVAHVLDELAYTVGVWRGAIRHRRLSVVMPRLRR